MTPVSALGALFRAWGAPEAERPALIDAAVAPDFYYADPHAPAPITSAASFLEFIAGFSRNMPGAAAELVEPVDMHHGHARCTVRFLNGGKVMMTGQYFADLDGEGRVSRLIGFAGRGAE